MALNYNDCGDEILVIKLLLNIKNSNLANKIIA